MNAIHTNNKTVTTNTAPLFASIWLALFSVLREHYFVPRASIEKGQRPTLKKPKPLIQTVASLPGYCGIIEGTG